MSDILDFTDHALMRLAVRFACGYELRQWHVMAFEWFADAFIPPIYGIESWYHNLELEMWVMGLESGHTLSTGKEQVNGMQYRDCCKWELS